MRQVRNAPIDRRSHELGRLADTYSSNGDSRQIERGHKLRAFPPEVFVSPTLTDSKKTLLVQVPMLVMISRRSLGPTVSPFGGDGDLISLAWVGRALIERHYNIRAQAMLHLDRALRREVVQGAVEMRFECHTLIGNLVELV